MRNVPENIPLFSIEQGRLAFRDDAADADALLMLRMLQMLQMLC